MATNAITRSRPLLPQKFSKSDSITEESSKVIKEKSYTTELLSKVPYG